MVVTEEAKERHGLGIAVVAHQQARTIQAHLGEFVNDEAPQWAADTWDRAIDNDAATSWSRTQVATSAGVVVRVKRSVVDAAVGKVGAVVDVWTFLDDATGIETSHPALGSRQAIGGIGVNGVTTTGSRSLETCKRKPVDVGAAIAAEHDLGLSGCCWIDETRPL